jgi:hypothetical protein
MFLRNVGIYLQLHTQKTDIDHMKDAYNNSDSAAFSKSGGALRKKHSS